MEPYLEEKLRKIQTKDTLDILSILGECRKKSPEELSERECEKLDRASALLLAPGSETAGRLYRAAGGLSDDPVLFTQTCGLSLEVLADGCTSSSMSTKEIISLPKDLLRRYLGELKSPSLDPDKYDMMAVGEVSLFVSENLLGQRKYRDITGSVLDLTPDGERERCREEAGRIVGSCVAQITGKAPSRVWPGPVHSTIYSLAHQVEKSPQAYLGWNLALEHGEIPEELPSFLAGISRIVQSRNDY